MKKNDFFLVIFVIFILTDAVRGQTNTFPSSGNVGIGTTSPGELLTVQGDAQFQRSGGSGLYIQSPSTDVRLFAVTSSGSLGQNLLLNPGAGDVGIGTFSPVALLDVSGPGSFEGGITVANTPNIGINNGLILGTAAKASSPSGGQGAIQIISNDTANQLQGFVSLVTDPTGSNRRLVIEAVEQGVAFRNVILAQDGGNVGIGTIDPAYPLSVNGTIEAKEVLVQTGWSDYVFGSTYRLKPLSEVESYIKAEHHLPGIPSEKQVAAKGVNLGNMQAKLLAQIEELTLRQIEQEKRLEDQSRRIEQLERENMSLKTSNNSR